MQEINRKRALITGISGFVGPYLAKELLKHKYEVFGIDRTGSLDKDKEIRIVKCDLLDKENVFNVINRIKPDYIFHLAGFSSVKASWDKSDLCRKINVEGTKNLLDAIVKAKINPKILIITSAEVYGKPKILPLKENFTLHPESPYAKSRVEQEKLLLKYKNLDWIVSRSFNHTGPGQQPIFVIPEFAKQLAEIKLKKTRPEIFVGNLKAKRDFSDVRDVVAAYRILLERGKSHEIYNVCSGKSYLVKSLLSKMIEMSGKKVKVIVDKDKFRPVDIMDLKGDNKKFKKLGYKFKYNIDKTLKDSLNWWIKNI